jgi:transposase-like protein
MTPTISGTEPLREDTRRRVRVPAERRERLVDEFEKSGLSAARFARLAGVKYPTFANCVQKWRQRRAAGDAPTEAGEAHSQSPIRWFEAVREDRTSEGELAMSCGFHGFPRGFLNAF